MSREEHHFQRVSQMAKSAKPMNDLFYANLIVIPARGSQQSSREGAIKAKRSHQPEEHHSPKTSHPIRELPISVNEP
jgi:hypothetical protein